MENRSNMQLFLMSEMSETVKIVFLKVSSKLPIVYISVILRFVIHKV
jgi:hypothetical protein